MGKIDLGLFLTLEGITRRPTHVGLPGTKPDFADGHVLENDLVAPLDRYLMSGSGLGGIGDDHPSSILAGGCGMSLAPTGLDRNLLLRIGPSPDGVSTRLLEDHVIGKDCRQPNLGGTKEGKEEGKPKYSHLLLPDGDEASLCKTFPQSLVALSGVV